MSVVSFWFEFASPYSMITALRLVRALAAGDGAQAGDAAVRGLASCQVPDLAGVQIMYRPVTLFGLFKAVGQPALPNMQVPAKAQYLFHDVKRSLDLLGCPGFPSSRPPTWPPNTLLAGRMAWLLAQGPDFIRALDAGGEVPPAPTTAPLPLLQTAVLAEFVWRVYEAEFIAGQDIGSADVMARLWDKHVAGARNDLPTGTRAVELASGDAVKSGVALNTQTAAGIGLFGAPSFTADDGAIYWGNDRLLDAVAHYRVRHMLTQPSGPATNTPSI
ncbi:hypothetical protein H4R19_004112 [Coemansia spiralis]|nr:hypothetical protein H4R19_004112 [Coemansia spiralis]